MNIEVIYLIHYCLYFRFNKKKYLLGSSNTLNSDSSALRKLKIDHIILPAFPFNSEHKLFLWCFELLNKLEYQSIVVSDMTTKKKIDSILAHSPEINHKNWKWQMMKQHQFNQDQLMKIYEDILSKNNQVPLYMQPHGLAFNTLPDQLNFIIPEEGRSILITNFNDSYLIDPTEKIQELLHYYGIPFSSLKAIILTKPTLNMFQMLQRQGEADLITTQQIYKEVKKQLKLYFHWDDEILKSKIKGRIMIEQKKSYKYSNLQFSYTQSKSTGIQFMDIIFGLKRVRIYPKQLTYYPSELQTVKDLQYLIAYDIEKSLKNQLQGCPEIYRKKIIYNRVTRKYNNKYFHTFNKNQCYVTVNAHQYLTQKIRNTLLDLPFLYKQNDSNRSLFYKQLKNGQKFNASERIIYVRKGYIKDQKGVLHSAIEKIMLANEIVGEGNAIIMYEPLKNIYFTQKSKLLDKLSVTMTEDLLKRVKQNSFISSLKKREINPDPLILEHHSYDQQTVEANSQWDVFNSVCSLKTFEGGTTLGKPMSLYFIVKGCMKYSNDEKQALKSMGIGNIRKFYSQAYQDTDDIEVVKDTWALQVSIKELHLKFMTKFPTKIYQLFRKPLIFD